MSNQGYGDINAAGFKAACNVWLKRRGLDMEFKHWGYQPNWNGGAAKTAEVRVRNYTPSLGKRGRHKKVRPPIACEECGKTFVPTADGRKSCSGKCGRLLSGKRRRGQKYKHDPNREFGKKMVRMIPCIWCGTVFNQKDARRKCCGKKCGLAFGHDNKRRNRTIA